MNAFFIMDLMVDAGGIQGPNLYVEDEESKQTTEEVEEAIVHRIHFASVIKGHRQLGQRLI